MHRLADVTASMASFARAAAEMGVTAAQAERAFRDVAAAIRGETEGDRLRRYVLEARKKAKGVRA